MSYLFSEILPSLHALKSLRKSKLFVRWLTDYHGLQPSPEIFEGYRFAIRCCLNSFLDGISDDYVLKIKNDLLLERALHEMIPLHKIDNSCEKTVFLKRVNPFVKEIIRAKDFAELEMQISRFQKAVGSLFDQINKEYVSVNSKVGIKKSTAQNISLLNFMHTYMIQITGNGPVANFFNPMNVHWEKEDRMNYYLQGYKYAMQFFWFKFLGEKRFKNSSLVNLHLVDSWREYTYIVEGRTTDGFDFGKEFDLEKQNSVDSYFWRIKQEITDKLDAKYKLFVHQIDSVFKFHSSKYSKRLLFSQLLKSDGLKNPVSELAFKDKIRYILYWYPIEVVNVRETAMHFGNPSFNIMLAGTVALHKKEQSNLKKVVVAKFCHPHTENRNKIDYSYGILIDTISAAGHYNSGWVIYQNTCGNYSGFSGKEYKTTETLINSFRRAGKIELRELVIPLAKFQEFTVSAIKNSEEISILEQNKLVPELIQQSRAYCFELFVYYAHTRFYRDKSMTIDMNAKGKGGEKDIVLSNEEQVIIVECKLDPNTYHLYEVIEKIQQKLKDYPQKNKSFQLWFWYEPSTQNEIILKEHNIKSIIVPRHQGEPILKNVDLKRLKHIMQDYDIPIALEFN
jgi:hypothetical protein